MSQMEFLMKNKAVGEEYQLRRVNEENRDKIQLKWDATDSETIEYSFAAWAFVHFLRAMKKDPQKFEALAAQIELTPDGERPDVPEETPEGG